MAAKVTCKLKAMNDLKPLVGRVYRRKSERVGKECETYELVTMATSEDFTSARLSVGMRSFVGWDAINEWYESVEEVG